MAEEEKRQADHGEGRHNRHIEKSSKARQHVGQNNRCTVPTAASGYRVAAGTPTRHKGTNGGICMPREKNTQNLPGSTHTRRQEELEGLFPLPPSRQVYDICCTSSKLAWQANGKLVIHGTGTGSTA
jgi:hypothetical protein